MNEEKAHNDIGYAPFEFSLDKVFAVLNDGKFTREDFYQAEKIWLVICDRVIENQISDCKGFWDTYEAKYCPSLRKKWLNCNRYKKILTEDRVCGEKLKNKKRILATAKDVDEYNGCCYNRGFPLRDYEKKYPNEIYKLQEESFWKKLLFF